MSRIVYQKFQGLAVPASASVDVWSIVSGSLNKVQLHGFELTSNATSAAIISVALRRISAVGSGGTASTTKQMRDEYSSASTATVRTLDTTIGTDIGGGIMAWQWEQLGPIGIVWTPETRLVAKVSQGFALTWNTATAATVSGWLCWEEM